MEFLRTLLSAAASVVVSVFVSITGALHHPTVTVVLPVPAPTTAGVPLSPASGHNGNASESGTPASSSKWKLLNEKSGLAGASAQASSTGRGDPRTFQEGVSTQTPDQVNDAARAAVVNIYCTTLAGGDLNPISGSGVVIDSRGIILTNAHVAQFLLLRDYLTKDNIDCVVRTGGPAAPRYRAQVLYLPPEWVVANAEQIKKEHATGTGQFDYAFLRITGATNGKPLPDPLPHVPMSVSADSGQRVVLAAYPAGFLDGINTSKALYLTSAITTIGQLYSFGDTHTVDILSVGGTVVSQSGASGGAVVRVSDGALVGIITTDSNATTTSARNLYAVSINYIDRALSAAGKGGILGLLSGDLAQKAADFATTTAPQETQLLESALTPIN
ncbi:MAG: trypsin-like peptidase domain-containing protein [Patescibacteria group bacterium]|nr:trypsin-like peptidase domain-containing protein [Patescibacteria group bacterium]